MTQILRVRECEACGEVCSYMDTGCPRCQRYGTLRDRLQCSKCKRLLDEKICWECGNSTDISVSAAGTSGTHTPEINLDTQRGVVNVDGVPDWVGGAVAGIILGGLAGSVAAYFLGGEPWLAGIVGGVAGAVVGAFMGVSGNSGPRQP